MKMQEYVAALRRMADWLEQHPDVPVPVETLRMSAHFQPEEIGLIPEGREVFHEPKRTTDGGLYQRFVDGDGFQICFYCGLRRVAEEQVVGTRTSTVDDVTKWVIKRPETPQGDAETPQGEPEAKIAG